MSKKNVIKAVVYISGAIAAPFVASAQELKDLESSTMSILGSVAPILIGLAVVFFLWQMIKFTSLAESDKERAEAKGLMVYSVIAILVMVSIWGIIALLTNIFGLQNTKTITNFEEIVPPQP